MSKSNSVQRIVSVLNSFTSTKLQLTCADISRVSKVSIATTHRILVTLEKNGFLSRNYDSGKYTIGPSLFILGNLYLKNLDVSIVALPVVKTINDLTNEAVAVGILNKGNVVTIVRQESEHPFRIIDNIGSIYPAYASSAGKALLSELTETELDSLYPEEGLRPLTTKTITTKSELKLELEQIKKTGVAFNREGAYEGVEGIASVILDASGRAIAAIGFTVPVFRMNKAYRSRLASLVRMGSSLISYRFGFENKDNPVRTIEQMISWWEQSQLDLASQANSLTRGVPLSRYSTVE